MKLSPQILIASAVLALAQAVWQIADPAVVFGVGPSTLTRRLAREGIHVPVDRSDVWTSHEVSVLKRHYKRGLSAAEIGERLNRTRNEVIGKAGRLGLSSGAR